MTQETPTPAQDPETATEQSPAPIGIDSLISRRKALIFGVGAITGSLATTAILLNNPNIPNPTPTPEITLPTHRPKKTPRLSPSEDSNPTLTPSIETTPKSTSERIPGLFLPGDVLYSIPSPNHRAALTIDDCLNEKVVQEYLDLANEYRKDGFPVSFTFFPRGDAVEKFPDIFKRILAEGHELGTHTWNHPFLSTLDAKTVRHQIKRGLNAIRDNVDPNYRVKLFRAPFGDGVVFGSPIDPEIEAVCKEFGLVIAGWNKDSIDTKYSFIDEKTAVKDALENLHTVRQGDIALFHANFPNSVSTVRSVIDQIRKSGKVKVDKTLSELIKYADSIPQTGVIYQSSYL